jgi:tRNA pseudouridine65 synthase
MLLHAWRLRFAHPLTGAAMETEAPLDAAYIGLLDRFGWTLPGVSEEE